jgi:hypothetical protein
MIWKALREGWIFPVVHFENQDQSVWYLQKTLRKLSRKPKTVALRLSKPKNIANHVGCKELMMIYFAFP